LRGHVPIIGNAISAAATLSSETLLVLATPLLPRGQPL